MAGTVTLPTDSLESSEDEWLRELTTAHRPRASGSSTRDDGSDSAEDWATEFLTWQHRGRASASMASAAATSSGLLLPFATAAAFSSGLMSTVPVSSKAHVPSVLASSGVSPCMLSGIVAAPSAVCSRPGPYSRIVSRRAAASMMPRASAMALRPQHHSASAAMEDHCFVSGSLYVALALFATLPNAVSKMPVQAIPASLSTRNLFGAFHLVVLGVQGQSRLQFVS